MSSMFGDNSQLLVRWTDWSLIKLYMDGCMCVCIYIGSSSFPPLLFSSSFSLSLCGIYYLLLSTSVLLFIWTFHFDCLRTKSKSDYGQETNESNHKYLDSFFFLSSSISFSSLLIEIEYYGNHDSYSCFKPSGESFIDRYCFFFFVFDDLSLWSMSMTRRRRRKKIIAKRRNTERTGEKK